METDSKFHILQSECTIQMILFVSFCRRAFNIVVMFWLFCGVLLLLLTCTVKHDEEIVHETVKQSVLRKLSLQNNLANHVTNFENSSFGLPGDTAEYSDASYVKICEDERSTSIIIDRTSSNDCLLPPNRNVLHKTENKITIKHNRNKAVGNSLETCDEENPQLSIEHTRSTYTTGKQFTLSLKLYRLMSYQIIKYKKILNHIKVAIPPQLPFLFILFLIIQYQKERMCNLERITEYEYDFQNTLRQYKVLRFNVNNLTNTCRLHQI